MFHDFFPCAYSEPEIFYTQFPFKSDHKNVLYFPIKDDTTKATVTMTCNGDKPDRLVIFGDNTKDTTYNVAMSSKGTTVTVDDIDDYIRTVEGKKYLSFFFCNGKSQFLLVPLIYLPPINIVE